MKEGKYYIPVNQMLGYKYDDNGDLYINQKEAEIIKLIYSMYLEGKGTHIIANYLHENKIPNKRGNKWSPSTIRNILRNEKYVGDVLFQKTYVSNVLTHESKRNYGEKDQYIAHNVHPAIIDRESWNAVQAKMNAAIVKYNIPSHENGKLLRDTNKLSAYASFVLCPYCGNYYQHKINHYNGKPTTRFLMCAQNKNGKLCESDNYPVNELNAIMAKIIGQIRKDIPYFKKELLLAFTNTNLDKTDNEIADIQLDIKAYRSKYKSAAKSSDEFENRMKYVYLDKLNELALQKSKLIHEKSVAINPNVEIKNIIDSLDNVSDDPNTIEESPFRKFFKKCIIVKKGFIYFLIGNDTVTKPKLNPSHLLFEGEHTYIVRKTQFKTKYGIIINK